MLQKGTLVIHLKLVTSIYYWQPVPGLKVKIESRIPASTTPLKTHIREADGGQLCDPSQPIGPIALPTLGRGLGAGQGQKNNLYSYHLNYRIKEQLQNVWKQVFSDGAVGEGENCSHRYFY